MIDVKRMLHPLSAREQDYSVELGQLETDELQLELFCEDDEVERAIELIQRDARTGAAESGWIYMSPVESA